MLKLFSYEVTLNVENPLNDPNKDKRLTWTTITIIIILEKYIFPKAQGFCLTAPKPIIPLWKIYPQLHEKKSQK